MGFVEEVVYGLAQGIQGGYSTMAFVTKKFAGTERRVKPLHAKLNSL